MIFLAPHIAAFLQQRLPIERRASPNTCDSYAHAFRLLFEYASVCLKLPPSQLQLEQLDAPLIVNFLNHLETSRGNGAGSRNIRLAAIKSFMHYMEYRVPSALEQIQRILAIPAKKTDTRLVRHLTAQEMQSILDAPDPTVPGLFGRGGGIRTPTRGFGDRWSAVKPTPLRRPPGRGQIPFYLISLCAWCLRQCRQNFFISRRSVVVFLFFVEE